MNEYKIFFNWLFDGDLKSPIPIPNPECEILDILKYNSYITHTFLISLFVKCGKLNYYFNKYMNNINIRYIDRKELMFYIKECIIENSIKKSQLYYSVQTRKTKLFEGLRKKFPYLKNSDISLLCRKIDDSSEKDSVYQTLGIDKLPKIKKIKKIKNEKISLEEFIKNFSVVEIEGT